MSFFIKGIVYCLEAARDALTDANSLYNAGRFASAIVQGEIALENLGQAVHFYSQLKAGGPTKPQQLDHDELAKHGLVSFLYDIPFESGQPPTQEEIWKMMEERHAAAPKEFQRLRYKAQYVTPRGCGDWQRPTEITKGEAHSLLMNVGNSFRWTLLDLLMRDEVIVKQIEELRLKEKLLDSKLVWPSPEGDAAV